MTQPALRPYLPADAPLLAAIFQASVEELTGDDYTEAQQAAWASEADDEAAFGARLAAGLTLVATLDGTAVGFASLKDNLLVDLLYVHPDAVGQGVGTALCDGLERLAAARGAKEIKADASDNAEGFFTARGYQPQRRNTVTIGGEWLATTTLMKPLATSPAASPR
ncbi:GNAT family N-acetyltransferase [Salinarimonas soli]|uniref:GNAT family N-acetyltransferase n=1 Tax=Salinarimonas soli TaxID=1638099 RepID=A0A5B2VGJ0_9HYPH|nr:GNAT family N-acetyltransferase [Salinarimonas soli]KAA2237459.1 GNAT family N-acetyltransferase [Salinarimonas soli]